MKSSCKLMLLLLTVVIAFSVCSGTEAGAGEKSVIQIMGPWIVENPESQVLSKVIEGFKETFPQYEIELIGVPSAQVVATVQSMAVSKTLPDLVILNGAAIASWKEMGIIEDIAHHYDQEFLNGFYPEMLDEFTYQGELMGLPMCAASFVLLLRNDLLKEAGIEPPKNFEEILAAAKALTVDSNNDGRIDRYGMTLLGFPDSNATLRFVLALFASGAPDVYLGEDGKWHTAIGSPEALRTFQLFFDLVLNNDFVPPGSPEVNYLAMVNLMVTDQAAMAISGPHTIGNIVAQNPDMAGKFIAVPLIDKKPAALLNAYGMIKFKDSPNSEGAIEFLKYASQNFLEMTRITKRLPARKEAADAARVEAPEIAAILDCAQYSINYVSVPFRGTVQDVIAEHVNAMLSGVYASPQEAQTAMASAVQAVLDENN